MRMRPEDWGRILEVRLSFTRFFRHNNLLSTLDFAGETEEMIPPVLCLFLVPELINIIWSHLRFCFWIFSFTGGIFTGFTGWLTKGSLLEQDVLFPFQLKMSDLGLKDFIFLNLNFILGVFDGPLASLGRNSRPGVFNGDWNILAGIFLGLDFLSPRQEGPIHLAPRLHRTQ